MTGTSKQTRTRSNKQATSATGHTLGTPRMGELFFARPDFGQIRRREGSWLLKSEPAAAPNLRGCGCKRGVKIRCIQIRRIELRSNAFYTGYRSTRYDIVCVIRAFEHIEHGSKSTDNIVQIYGRRSRTINNYYADVLLVHFL